MVAVMPINDGTFSGTCSPPRSLRQPVVSATDGAGRSGGAAIWQAPAAGTADDEPAAP
jgi:hypothetical protein